MIQLSIKYKVKTNRISTPLHLGLFIGGNTNYFHTVLGDNSTGQACSHSVRVLRFKILCTFTKIFSPDDQVRPEPKWCGGDIIKLFLSLHFLQLELSLHYRPPSSLLQLPPSLSTNSWSSDPKFYLSQGFEEQVWQVVSAHQCCLQTINVVNCFFKF